MYQVNQRVIVSVLRRDVVYEGWKLGFLISFLNLTLKIQSLISFRIQTNINTLPKLPNPPNAHVFSYLIK